MLIDLDVLAVTHVEVSYRRSVTYDDEVVIHTWLAERKRASLTIGYRLLPRRASAMDLSGRYAERSFLTDRGTADSLRWGPTFPSAWTGGRRGSRESARPCRRCRAHGRRRSRSARRR